MKGKLVKTIGSYELFTQGFLKGSTNHELIDSLNVEEGSIRYKLSVKNCQAIGQSTTQTEWDVEIVMERVLSGYEIVNSNPKVKGSGDKILKYEAKPKLDKDGCLILKRI